MTIELKTPVLELLPHYVDALKRGWTPDHILASQKVITANRGVLFESFTKPAAFGSVPGLRYRIAL